MNTFEIEIVVAGPDPMTDDFEKRFFEAGCDDATIVVANGVITLQFARQARNLDEAIASVRASVERAGGEVKLVRPVLDERLFKAVDVEMLTRVGAEMPVQTESAGDFIRKMRDSDRY
jgi:hypothetical protein